MAEAEDEGGPAQAGLGGDQDEEGAQAEAEGERREGLLVEGGPAVDLDQGLAAEQEQRERAPPQGAGEQAEQDGAVAGDQGDDCVAGRGEEGAEGGDEAEGQVADRGEEPVEQAEERAQAGQAADRGAQAAAGGERALAGHGTELAAELEGVGGELAAESGRAAAEIGGVVAEGRAGFGDVVAGVGGWLPGLAVPGLGDLAELFGLAEAGRVIGRGFAGEAVLDAARERAEPHTGAAELQADERVAGGQGPGAAAIGRVLRATAVRRVHGARVSCGGAGPKFLPFARRGAGVRFAPLRSEVGEGEDFGGCRRRGRGVGSVYTGPMLLGLLLLAAPVPTPETTPWAEAGGRPWTSCREYERQAEQLLRSSVRSEETRGDTPWPARARECPNAPAVLVMAALLELVDIPSFPPLADLQAALPTLAEEQRATRQQARAWLRRALVEAERRGEAPPALTHYFLAYAALGLGDWAGARVALLEAERLGEVEPWRTDRAFAVAALLAGELAEALRRAHRSREFASAADRSTSVQILALIYDRAGAPEAALRELAGLRAQSYGEERGTVETVLPLHERIYLQALQQQVARAPGSAMRLWDAYLACPEPAPPERKLVERRREELRPRGSVVPSGPTGSTKL